MSFDSPAWTVAKMRGVQITRQGHLRWFRAIPRNEVFEANKEVLDSDWHTWFSPDVIGFELRNLAVSKRRRPTPDAADEVQAWEGRLVGSDENVFVQTASFRGRPTFFSVSLERPKLIETKRVSSLAWTVHRFGQVTMGILLSSVVIGAPFLAIRHYRTQRIDHHGARRVAVAIFAISIVGWALETSHVADLWETFLLIQGLRQAMFAGGMAWFIYVGAEPLIRRHLPQALISRTRLLQGEWMNSRIGRELLVALSFAILGALGNAVKVAVTNGGFEEPYSLTRRLTADWSAVGDILCESSSRTSIVTAFFCIFVLFKVLLKSAYLAGIAFAFLIGFTLMPAHISTSGELAIHLVSSCITGAILAWTAFRFGLLVWILVAFIVQCFTWPLTISPSQYSFQSSIAVIVFILSLVCWGAFAATRPRYR